MHNTHHLLRPPLCQMYGIQALQSASLLQVLYVLTDSGYMHHTVSSLPSSALFGSPIPQICQPQPCVLDQLHHADQDRGRLSALVASGLWATNPLQLHSYLYTRRIQFHVGVSRKLTYETAGNSEYRAGPRTDQRPHRLDLLLQSQRHSSICKRSAFAHTRTVLLATIIILLSP